MKQTVVTLILALVTQTAIATEAIKEGDTLALSELKGRACMVTVTSYKPLSLQDLSGRLDPSTVLRLSRATTVNIYGEQVYHLEHLMAGGVIISKITCKQLTHPVLYGEAATLNQDYRHH